MQISKMQTTPAAESTRIPLRTSTEKREKSLSSEQLLDLEKSEQYRQELKKARENMLQACLEKSSLESQEAELIRFRALKAQKEFWDLERKRDENRKTIEKMQEKIRVRSGCCKFLKAHEGIKRGRHPILGHGTSNSRLLGHLRCPIELYGW